jgi:hypothetical protein
MLGLIRNSDVKKLPLEAQTLYSKTVPSSFGYTDTTENMYVYIFLCYNELNVNRLKFCIYD